jgi:hypothetical protein
MELRTSEITRQAYGKVSPYQNEINVKNKVQALNAFRGTTLFIWAFPIVLTLSEATFLKYGKTAQANKFGLYKWISIILATVATNFTSAEAIRRAEYYDRLFPLVPQIQKEHIRDAEIIKRTVNI